MTVDGDAAPGAAGNSGAAFLEYGFRPFFLGAGVQAVLAMSAWTLWLVLREAGVAPENPTVAPPVQVWHAHEMIFGYTLAVAAGFFLTAVPSWTGRRPVRGRMLGILFALWVAARLASWFSASLPPLAVALPELAFIAMLTALVARALLSSRSRRNFLFLPVLAAILAAAALYHLGYTYPAHTLGLDALLLLIAVVGGRIVPAFTMNALRRKGVEPLPRAGNMRDIAAILSVVFMAMADIALPGSAVAGAAAIVAGALAAYRMIGWRTPKVLDAPILWILHLGYGWLAFGFALKGVAVVTGVVSQVAAIHALTVGAIGSMTIGVMTRAALGHTGRVLKVSGAITAAYGLVSLSAVIRVSGVTLADGLYQASLLVSGAAWVIAFLIFVVTYWPILTRPRFGRA